MAALAPNGCRLCGIGRDIHAIQVGRNGSHTWIQPTQQQIKDRMLMRRKGRG
jgi:hypothetical protein